MNVALVRKAVVNTVPRMLRVLVRRTEAGMDLRKFLEVSTKHLGLNPCHAPRGWSWCSWTTFDRLGRDAGYWQAPLPLEVELLEEYVADGGTWRQPFGYTELAHIIVPRCFTWEVISAGAYESGVHHQDIVGLSERLTAEGIAHRLTDLVLEVKLY